MQEDTVVNRFLITAEAAAALSVSAPCDDPRGVSRFGRTVGRWRPVVVVAAFALAVSLGALPAAAGQRTAGIVKWFNDSRGFGAITPNGGGREVFVRVDAIKTHRGLRTLVPGEHVEFSIVNGPKGPIATNVTPAP
jgi:CspA family cold shock protein